MDLICRRVLSCGQVCQSCYTKRTKKEKKKENGVHAKQICHGNQIMAFQPSSIRLMLDSLFCNVTSKHSSVCCHLIEQVISGHCINSIYSSGDHLRRQCVCFFSFLFSTYFTSEQKKMLSRVIF